MLVCLVHTGHVSVPSSHPPSRVLHEHPRPVASGRGAWLQTCPACPPLGGPPASHVCRHELSALSAHPVPREGHPGELLLVLRTRSPVTALGGLLRVLQAELPTPAYPAAPSLTPSVFIMSFCRDRHPVRPWGCKREPGTVTSGGGNRHSHHLPHCSRPTCVLPVYLDLELRTLREGLTEWRTVS